MSMGIATASGGDETDLLRNASIALYLAKTGGKDRWEFFDTEAHAEIGVRLLLRAELQRAIGAGEFVVHYQPIVDIGTGCIVRAEALARWNHPERGLLPPSDFIEGAESTGLIVPLGRFVLNQALRDARRWQVESGRALTMSVNVSPRQLLHPGFESDVRAAMQASGAEPDSVILEITESGLLNTDSARLLLSSLKRLGVGLAIDDFGTGYSSYSHLERFPVDEVKIDRSFIAQLQQDRKQQLTASIIDLCRTLGLTTVAEGVETRQQLDALRAMGCQLAQGFLFSQPMPAAKFDALLVADRAAA
jgi:EAL domain-containing protein (putative c-di-GMP-specific phosphodiesterase class I)